MLDRYRIQCFFLIAILEESRGEELHLEQHLREISQN